MNVHQVGADDGAAQLWCVSCAVWALPGCIRSAHRLETRMSAPMAVPDRASKTPAPTKAPRPRKRMAQAPRRAESAEDRSEPGVVRPAVPPTHALSRDEIKKRLLWLAAGKPGNGPA